MHILWLTTQFPVGEINRNGMFIYRTVSELSTRYKITVLVLHPVIPPFVPMLKNFRNWRNIYDEWRSKFPRNPQKPKESDNINIIYSNYYRPPRPHIMFLESWGSYFNAKKIIKKLDKNNLLIHANWIFPEGYLAHLFAKKYKIPFILTLRGGDFIYLNKNTPNKYFAEVVLSSARKITAVSQSLLEEGKEKGVKIPIEKFAITNNFYDFNLFKIKSQIETRDLLNLPSESKMIFFAGALRKIKNIYLLLESLKQLLNIYDQIHLLLAGYGYEENNLKTFITENHLSENVSFIGNLDVESLINYYNAADLLCLPSFSEGFPNVVVESLLCGTPVVGASVGGIPKIINHGINGYLIDPRKKEELTDALIKTLNNKWDREQLRESVSFLSSENVFKQYDSLYNEVFNKKLIYK